MGGGGVLNTVMKLHKIRRISWLAEELLLSQKEIRYLVG